MDFLNYSDKISKSMDKSVMGLEYDLRFDIVDFVLEKLRQKNLSQLGLSEKMNMKPSQLNRILSAEENLTLRTIARLYKTLNAKPKITERNIVIEGTVSEPVNILVNETIYVWLIINQQKNGGLKWMIKK